LLACEGKTFDPDDSDSGGGGGGGGGGAGNKSAASKQALHDWLDEGGKVFATHYHYTWFKNGPADFKATANWLGSSGGDDDGAYAIDTTFPKGKVFSEWLGTVGALTNGQINLTQVAESVGTVKGATQRWIYNPNADTQSTGNGMTNDVKYMSILTP